MTEGVLSYVALGDSYTIGTSVEPGESWPEQLVAHLGPVPPTLELVANLGVNGYTSRDILDHELPQLDSLRPEFVSLLVGVNDVVQRVTAGAYRGSAALILDTLLDRLTADRIVTVETPDYTVTPHGASYGDPSEQSASVARNNGILEELALERGMRHVGGIFGLSRGAADDRSLVADDGLHPSGRQYALWVELIAPVIDELLGR